MRRSTVPFAMASAAYALLTIAFTWPIILHPRTLVPSDLGDPLLNVWIVWWNATTLPLTEAWWNAPQFYPFKGAMALSEHLLGLAPITTPIILVTSNPLLAYNVAFVLSFFLCGLSAHFLVFTITRRHDVAFVGGLAFAFAPYRMAQFAHIPVLSAYWMPLALAGLHRYFFDIPSGASAPRTSHVPTRRPAKWLFLFAFAWMMQALACGYYFFFLSVLVALWLAWFALFRGDLRALINVLVAWAIAAILLAPVLYGYWRFSEAYNLHRTINEIRAFSADIASVLKAWGWLVTWGWLNVVERPESDLFPGVTVVAVAAIGIAIAWRRTLATGNGYPRAARVLALMGVIATGVAGARGWYGPFRLEIGGIVLLSVTSPEKPVSVAVLCFFAAAMLHPVVRTAWRNRSVLAFYALATFAMWLMTLGPSPTLMNAPAIYKAPYAWLLYLPGVDGVRVPARFWMLAALCLGVTAALALRVIQQRWPRSGRWLVALVALGVLVDGWPRAVPTAIPPAARPSHTDADLRLELPFIDVDTLALYRAMEHRRPVINGYSGYFPAHYWGLRDLFAERDPAVLEVLAELGSLEIVVDHALDSKNESRELASRAPGVKVVYTDSDYTSYFVPAMHEGLADASGPRLTFVAAGASINPQLAPLINDGNLYTRWHAGRAQRRGDWLMVDLGSSKDVTGLRMLIGGYSRDYPRQLRVETSDDQQTWSSVWYGSTAIRALTGALQNPRDAPVSITWEPHRARYIRMTQASADLVYYWSVAELEVLGK